MSAFVIPGGRSKDTPIGEAADKDLEYWIGRISGDLEQNPEKRFADRDRAWLDAARAELAQRGGGGAGAAPSQPRQRRDTPPAQPAPRQDMVRAADIAGSYGDHREANQALTSMAGRFHLVSPASACPELPAGCVLAMSAVRVDVARDTYRVGSEYGLSKHVLDQIAAAAGVSWDVSASGRLDDGSDPHYCHYRAVGRYRSFDGQLLTISGTVEMDLREGSPQVDEIRSKAEESSDEKRRREGGARQIMEMRKFLLRHAESKAKNRAVRSLGVRTAYTRDELQRPFAVARLQFTGRTEDPALKQVFGQALAASFLGSTPALYGAGGRQGGSGSPAPAMAAPATRGHAPPPVQHRETVTADGEVIDADFEPDFDEYDRGDSADAY